MDKQAIWLQRKQLKKAGHLAVKQHYFLLVFLCLILIFFGIEFQSARMSWGQLYSAPDTASQEEDSSAQALNTAETSLIESLLDQIWQERQKGGQYLGDKVLTRQQQVLAGATKGVLASMINDLSSGRLFYLLAQRIYSIVASDTWTRIILTSLILAFVLFLYVFLRCYYSAAFRRVVLEARLYPKTGFPTLFHINRLHRWLRASLTMFVKEILYSLWSLTLVGIVVKRYSYMAVPYIVAENPGLSPLEAITLSRRMMDGHKLEMFRYELTLLPWRLLGILTFGISDMLYGVPYLVSCEAEFYVKVREDAIQRGVEGIQSLCDPYLFEKADKILLYETYFDVVDEITLLHEDRMELKGIRKTLCQDFGIWLGSLSEKRRYDDQQGRAYLLEGFQRSMAGESYPQRLGPFCQKKEIPKQGNFFFLRSYSPHTLFLLFISFAMIGWVWEVALHLWQTGEFANRGTMYGPWLPIYGWGGMVAVVLCNRFRKKPVLEFFVAMTLCGVLEYLVSWYLEQTYHRQWWSYEGYFLNLNGRVCAEGLLVFGLACIAVVYVVAPLFDYHLSLRSQRTISLLCICLGLVFAVDWVYSGISPNMAEGAVEAVPQEETQAGQQAPQEEEEILESA